MNKNANEWKHAVVLGAAGKMGSGIALSLLQEMSEMKERAVLTLLDVDFDRFDGLKKYLRDHFLKFAERSINRLRVKYAHRDDLIDNSEIIDVFVAETMDQVRFVTSPSECRGAQYIFEAIAEDVEIKTGIFKQIISYVDPQAYFFTNTSSIPISVLEQKSQLEGRIIGFHFYNPPAVQKLLEIISPNRCEPGLKQAAFDLAKRLGKVIVPSHDIAGFIGNGHFIREILGACKQVRQLQSQLSSVGALYAINWVTQELLLRPMGIFQLVDYVGLDVCQHIGSIMTHYLTPHIFTDDLIARMLKKGIRGGQNPDGSQRDGFFHYEKGKPVAIYDFEKDIYISCSNHEPIAHLKEAFVKPENDLSWKALSKDPRRQERIAHYFPKLFQQDDLGAELARRFLNESKDIAYGLVRDGVANSVADVDTVLQYGFFHLYGVDQPFED